MEAVIKHYLSTQTELTSTDRLILMLAHDAGDEGTTVPELAGLCGTSWEYTQARIYLLQRIGLLHRVSPRHYALAQPAAPATGAEQLSFPTPVPVSAADGEAL